MSPEQIKRRFFGYLKHLISHALMIDAYTRPTDLFETLREDLPWLSRKTFRRAFQSCVYQLGE